MAPNAGTDGSPDGAVGNASPDYARDGDDPVRLPSPALMEAIGGCRLLSVDRSLGVVRAEFTARPEFCHTDGTIVQGGFVSAWLDFAMAFATVNRTRGAYRVASLELKVSFLEAVGPGKVIVEGRVLRLGRRVAFLEATLFDTSGRRLATGSSTALLVAANPSADTA
jgi:acyl-CoA thioesterase